MTRILDEDHGEEREYALRSVQDKLSFYNDVKATFGTPHGKRVLKDIADEKYLYDSIYTGNAKTHYNSGIQDYIRRILDVVAVADPETYQWLLMQRANELRGLLDAEIKAVRREDEP